MSYRYVWADGELEIGFGKEFHFALLSRMLEDGRLNYYPNRLVGGWYWEDTFHEGLDHITRDWEEGDNNPSDEELKQMIRDTFHRSVAANAIQKDADWSDITDKARRYLTEGRVEMITNQIDHAVATVYGDTGTYQTELWRDRDSVDPNDPDSMRRITLWSCTCPWGEVSWGRTRQWKKYEGRPCAHATALQWASQNGPFEGGDEQQTIPGMEEPVPQPNYSPSVVREPGQVLAPFVAPGAPVPGGPNPGMTNPNIMPVAPQTAPAPQPAPQPRQPSRLKGPNELGTMELPGTFSRVITSFFNNGDAVRAREPLYGQDSNGTGYVVPANAGGEVIWSDEEETIAIFSIKSGPLGPHVVRVQDDTDKFYLSPKAQPGIKKRR